MITFSELTSNKLTSNKPISLDSLNEGELEIGVSIPPDYCYLLLSSNGYSNIEGWQISIDGVNPIVEIDDFVSLEWLIKERVYDLKDEDAEIYRAKFLRIAGCLNQDRILIGFEKDVLNQIFLLDFDNDKLIKISDSIFDFINNKLIK